MAYAAEFYNYQEEVYLIACDADVARSWAPLDAAGSRISYLVPNRRVKERLILYGVREQKIYISGFPLPDSNIGGKGYPVTKVDLRDRVVKLDPRSHYREKYHDLLQQYLGAGLKEKTVARPLTVTFAVGGAGAQRAQAKTIVHALKTHLQEGDLQLNLIAGSRQDVVEYFLKIKRPDGLREFDNLHILYRANKMDYFAEFNQLLRQTDVLWTKPSELIFYSALGIPIIMAEPIGSQEGYNHDWLTTIGAGVDEQDPRYVDEWLFDWLNSGWLAQAAINGYLNAPKGGRHHIEEIVLRHRRSEIDNIHLL